MAVPSVDFASLNLLAPMPNYGQVPYTIPAHEFVYAGPSQVVRKITHSTATQGSILPVVAPAVNSSWDMTFHGPSVRCNPVDHEDRQAILGNLMNYTIGRGDVSTRTGPCNYGTGYAAWGAELLPFEIATVANQTTYTLNYAEEYEFKNSYETASLYVAVTPPLFTSHDGDVRGPWLCPGEPYYDAGVAGLYDNSTVLRCDLHNATYDAAFTVENGEQNIDVAVTDLTHEPMVKLSYTQVWLNSSDPDVRTNLQPSPCGATTSSPGDCVANSTILSELSYQAVMDAFTNLLAGVVSRGDNPRNFFLATATSQIRSTVLMQTPELAFLSTDSTGNEANLQERAAQWRQKPFAGLFNADVASRTILPLDQALEQVFQNITMSLMSAPELQ